MFLDVKKSPKKHFIKAAISLKYRTSGSISEQSPSHLKGHFPSNFYLEIGKILLKRELGKKEEGSYRLILVIITTTTTKLRHITILIIKVICPTRHCTMTFGKIT